MTLPLKSNILSFKVWDKDLLSPNKFLEEYDMRFKELAEICYDNNTDVQMHAKKGSEELKIKCKTEAANCGSPDDCGELTFSFELIPKERYVASFYNLK